MTDRERVNKLNDLICGLAHQGVLLDEDIAQWSEIMGDPVIDIYDMSVIHVENLGTQRTEMWIDHENERLQVHAYTKYIYDMNMHEITCVIDFANIVNVSMELIASVDRASLTIETDDDSYDFYFENQLCQLRLFRVPRLYCHRENWL